MALGAAGVLAGAAGSAAASGVLALTYDATMVGLPLAAVTATVRPGDTYHLTGALETRGIVGLFSRWRHEAASIGHVAPDGSGIAGVRHRGDGVSGGEQRFIQLLFDPTQTIVEAAKPDPDARSRSRRVPPDLRHGTLDPLSTFYALALQLENGTGCVGTMRVFDGRHRYDLILSDGPDALSCRFAYRPLAGFKRDSNPTVDASDRSPGIIRYARVAEGFPPVPERLEVPTRFGGVVVALSDWRVETRAADASR
ncbi:MAG: DUF3108 domain-containing protein [Alphaproteobacteria bacterium]